MLYIAYVGDLTSKIYVHKIESSKIVETSAIAMPLNDSMALPARLPYRTLRLSAIGKEM